MAKTTGKQKDHRQWLNNYNAASKWMAKYNVKKLLKQGGGLVKISNFFPHNVAEGILQDLQQIPDADWNSTAADDDYRHNNISHSFQSVRHAACLEAVIRVIGLLLPDMVNSFSAAKYTKSDHIAPHDDRAYTKVMMDDGRIMTCSRDTALILYLTKDWQEQWGGLLVDLEHAGEGGSKTYVPEFNSAILFKIPRWHQVTPMTTNRPRFTLFGWFLVPGKTYQLNLDGSGPPGAQAAGAAAAEPGVVAGKQKNTKKKRKAGEALPAAGDDEPGVDQGDQEQEGQQPVVAAVQREEEEEEGVRSRKQGRQEGMTGPGQGGITGPLPGPAGISMKKKKKKKHKGGGVPVVPLRAK